MDVTPYNLVHLTHNNTNSITANKYTSRHNIKLLELKIHISIRHLNTQWHQFSMNFNLWSMKQNSTLSPYPRDVNKQYTCTRI